MLFALHLTQLTFSQGRVESKCIGMKKNEVFVPLA